MACLKYLKRGWNTKEGRANKDFKKGGKLGQGVGALKGGGGGGGGGWGGTPLRTMPSVFTLHFKFLRCSKIY